MAGGVKHYLLPAPTGGLNTRDPYTNMPETDATELINFFPGSANLYTRGGSSLHSDLGGAGLVVMLRSFTDSTGAEKLVAYNASDSKLYDVTNGGSPSNVTGAVTLSAYYPRGLEFKNRLIITDGTNQPVTYTGSGNATQGGFTPTTAFANAFAYRNRLYFIDGQSVWYGAVDAVSGALTEFDFASILHRGGKLMFGGPTSSGIGFGALQDVFVVVSSMGEVLIYQGDYPGDSTWNLIQRYFIPFPLSYKAYFHTNADLNIISANGIIPMSHLLGNQYSGRNVATITEKVNTTFNTSGSLIASTYGTPTDLNIAPAHGIFYPSENMTICCPRLAAQHEILVMNNITGAWTEYASWGADAGCYELAVHKGQLYGAFIQGHVLQLEDGTTDYKISDASTQNITTRATNAYSFLGDPARRKKVISATPFVKIGAVGTCGMGTFDDFVAVSGAASNATSFALDANTQNEFARSIAAHGRAFAFQVAPDAAASAEYSAVVINFETGSFV